jgi:hypothetical protein
MHPRRRKRRVRLPPRRRFIAKAALPADLERRAIERVPVKVFERPTPMAMMGTERPAALAQRVATPVEVETMWRGAAEGAAHAAGPAAHVAVATVSTSMCRL